MTTPKQLRTHLVPNVPTQQTKSMQPEPLTPEEIKINQALVEKLLDEVFGEPQKDNKKPNEAA